MVGWRPHFNQAERPLWAIEDDGGLTAWNCAACRYRAQEDEAVSGGRCVACGEERLRLIDDAVYVYCTRYGYTRFGVRTVE